MIKADIIADSINPQGHRLTTFVVTFPRIVLAEVNTHRAFSRNSSSSRAIPFSKMLKMVKENPFIPLKFQKDHKGMQGTEYFEEQEHLDCVADWLSARDKAVEAATSFKHPVTKQLRNRLLEPFMWHVAIITATDFENFFALRAHKDAEIHIAALADKMLEVYNTSTPKKLKEGEWHVPFGDKIDLGRLEKIIPSGITDDYEFLDAVNHYSRMIAVARCARVSYYNFEGEDDYQKDVNTCQKLFGSIPRHLSPTEHVAMCMDTNDFYGNFQGWKQMRKFFKDENLKDPRVKK